MAFSGVRDVLTSAAPLVRFDPTASLSITADALGKAIRGVLQQWCAS